MVENKNPQRKNIGGEFVSKGDELDKKQKQNKVQVQGKYRKTMQRNRDVKNSNKIGAVIVGICLFILLLLYVLNAIFDL